MHIGMIDSTLLLGNFRLVYILRGHLEMADGLIFKVKLITSMIGKTGWPGYIEMARPSVYIAINQFGQPVSYNRHGMQTAANTL